MTYTVPLGEALGHTPSVKIVNFLLAHGHNDFSQKEIAEATGLVRQTVAKSMPRLLRFHLVGASRKIGHTTMYWFMGKMSSQAGALTRFVDELVGVVAQEEARKLRRRKK